MSLVKKLQGRIKEQKKTIVIIGDAMVDSWIHGRTADCQDGCKKFVTEKIVVKPGGAANAERSINKWGIERILHSRGVSVKTRYVEDNKILFRTDEDCIPPKTQHWIAVEIIKSAGAVLLSDYDKGMLTPDFIQDIVFICKQRGIPCVADCKRAPEVYVGCILKGNGDYWSKYQMPHVSCVATWGPCPPVINGKEIADNKLPRVQEVNHVGAGDCFAAHLTLALAYGFSLQDATRLAHSAGRVYVQHPHNRPPHPDEIEADLASITT